VGTQNSQKRSPRSSAKSEMKSAETRTSHPPKDTFGDFDHEEYMDRSRDHVARVREAKEAAQHEMESFGDVSEYDITIIQGQLKEEPAAVSQSSLDFQTDAPTEQGETE
jgi:hypothetical protein